MSVVLHLSGYDKNTDMLVVEYPVPSARADYVKGVAAVAKSDPDVLGAYPLDEAQVEQIAGQINTPVNPKLYHYFLEAHEDC
jgi:hypothetical protein